MLPEPQHIFRVMHDSGVPIEEMYRVFNMGVGFCAIVGKDEADHAVDVLGDRAHVIGEVTDKASSVDITAYTGESIRL